MIEEDAEEESIQIGGGHEIYDDTTTICLIDKLWIVTPPILPLRTLLVIK